MTQKGDILPERTAESRLLARHHVYTTQLKTIQQNYTVHASRRGRSLVFVALTPGRI